MTRPPPVHRRVLTRRVAAFWLVGIVALAAALRLRGLDRHFFWFDEGLLLNLDLLHTGVHRFVLTVWHTTTYNPGWALVVWLTTRAAGVTLWSARLPSCVAGVLNVALIYPTARALKLDRPTGLAASLLSALAWPQVEYSQQILPYAGVPLLTTLMLWTLARLDREDPARFARAARLCGPVLALVCTLDVANHNSFLMLVPFLGLALLVIAARHGLTWSSPEQRRAVVPLVACFGWVVAVSLFFYLPKRGEGYRVYLDPYYLATFRDHTMGYGPFADAFYKQGVPRANLVLDALYFGASRTYDTFVYAVDLFSPLYVTAAWGLVAAVPVGLAAWGLVAALRGKPSAPLRWVAFGLVVTLATLFGLSTVRLYPYGGIRQLLFLSPLVILLTAAGWRSAFLRYPVVCGVLTLVALTTYAVRAPAYYAGTAARLDEKGVVRMVRDTGIRTMVVPDFGEHYFMINYLYRNVPRRAIVDTFWPYFTVLLHRHEPFLLYARDPFGPDDFGPSPLKSPFYRGLIEEGFNFSDYDVTPVIAHEGGFFRSGQPNPGTHVYCFRPKRAAADPAPAAQPPRVLRTEPAPGTRTQRLVTEVAVEFSQPMDPATLTSQTIELWTRPAEKSDAPWVRYAPGAATQVTYQPLWKTALVQVAAPLPPDLYAVAVTDAVRDAHGRPLDGGTFYATFRLQPVHK